MLRKREELDDSDESINFSESEGEKKGENSGLERKIKNLAARDALIGKNAKTVVRDKEGNVSDLKDAREVRIAEIKKLNELIVGLISSRILRRGMFRPGSLRG